MRHLARFRRTPVMVFMAGFVMMGFSAGMPSLAADPVTPLNVEVAAAAQADECFYDVGSEDNFYNTSNLTFEEVNQCLDTGGKLRRNQGYLWGITKTGDDLWFGTSSNIQQTGLGGILQKASEDRILTLARFPSFKTPNMAFELNDSHYLDGENGFLGDYRPPRVYIYNLKSGEITDNTPNDPLISQTFGLRSAGYLNGVAILAGPVFHKEGLKGINMFAFDTVSKRFLGSCNIQELKDAQGNVAAEGISNIRKWLTVKGVLYTTVGTATGGKVLRWTGSAADPFRFDVVGDLDDQGVGLVYHENRLFIFTWPPSDDPNGFSLEGDPSNVCDVMMTKNEIPEGGLTVGTEFVSVWNVRNYEPDYITAASYGLGDAISYQGWLYWGTMHFPLASGLAHLKYYPRDLLTLRDIVRSLMNTNRQTVVFRGRNFASGNPEIQLLYGDEFLHQYQEDARLSRDAWVVVPNNMHVKPLYGDSGFGGHKANFYTWSMAEYNGELYMGVLDQLFPQDSESQVVNVVNRLINGFVGMVPTAMDDTIREILFPPDEEPGPNLYRFKDSNSPAIAETMNCFGNQGVYGIRNLIVADGSLYLGTVSSFNLHPTGGWNLYKLTAKE